ncbi:LuxR C-terminal-related transcriptional regulator, partial [Kibdelosporangium lantanae]
YLARATHAVARIPVPFFGLLPSQAGQAGAGDPVEWLTAERLTISTLLATANQLGLHDHAWRIPAVYAPYFDLRGAHEDWGRSHGIALEGARQAGDLHGEAIVQRNIGQLNLYVDRYAEAESALHESLRLFAEAGKRALSDGASESSVMLLDRANSLLQGEEATESKVEVVQLLLYALAEAGQIERARSLMDAVDEQAGASFDSLQRARLHTRLARVYLTAGLSAEGMQQVDLARSVLGPDAGAEHTAPVDVVAAHLTALAGGHNRMEKAESLARRAIAGAEPAGLAEVLCDAWQLVGSLARERSLDESNACYERMRALAEEHRLPIMRVLSLVVLAGNRWMAGGERDDMERTLHEAQRTGAVTVGYMIHGNLAIDAALRGDFARAMHTIEQNKPELIRLGLRAQVQYLLMVKATVAAHQGKRAEMDRALAEFAEWESEYSQEVPLTIGFARTFCALLEENRGLAREELLRMLVLTENVPTAYQLAGRHGLHLFLSVLDGDAGWAEYEQTAARVPSTMRWNRQFVRLAEAVLLGRDGHAEAAAAAVAAAQDDAAIYPVADSLGLRLVSEAAIADGWGEPVTWLRKAEEYFHQAAIAPVASACRSLLRHAGASVRQRRAGTDEVPDGLRAIGVTVREHEVLQLLVDRLTNKAIANRLHISPRTVEKHVASLILKAEVADRMELSDFAASAYGVKQ